MTREEIIMQLKIAKRNVDAAVKMLDLCEKMYFGPCNTQLEDLDFWTREVTDLERQLENYDRN